MPMAQSLTLNRPLAALALVLFMLTPAWAIEGLTRAQEASLKSTVSRFERTYKRGDLGGLFNFLPPKVLAEVAREHGVSVRDLKRSAARMTALMKDVKVIDSAMLLDRAKAKQLRNGMIYVVVPYYAKVRVGNSIETERSEAIAILDGGRWYLLRAKERKQVMYLKRAYPAFAGVRLP